MFHAIFLIWKIIDFCMDINVVMSVFPPSFRIWFSPVPGFTAPRLCSFISRPLLACLPLYLSLVFHFSSCELICCYYRCWLSCFWSESLYCFQFIEYSVLHVGPASSFLQPHRDNKTHFYSQNND